MTVNENVNKNVNETESIYHFITRMAAEQPGLPYAFQDESAAGRRDVLDVLWGEDVPVYDSEVYAKSLLDIVCACVGSADLLPDLRVYLEVYPLRLYLFKATARIRLILSEKLVDNKELYFLGLRLAMESDSEEEVRLGILILGFFENDLARDIVWTLGLHSSMTIYAVQAVRNYSDSNAFLYKFLQNTCGFGQLSVLAVFNPVHLYQQKWILKNGAANKVMPNMSAIMCLEMADMAAFYRNLVLDAHSFHALSGLFAYAGQKDGIKVFHMSRILVAAYMDVLPQYGSSFLDLAAVVVLQKGMAPSWTASGNEKEDENGWSGAMEARVCFLCSEYMKLPKSRQMMLAELREPCQSTSLITHILAQMQLTPNFTSFYPLLKRDVFDLDVMEFLLIRNEKIYTDDVKEYLLQLLPFEVFEGDIEPQGEHALSASHRPDIWLVYLLKALRREHQAEEDLYIRCLFARFAEVRIEAIQALRVCKLAWSDKVLHALENALAREPDAKISKRILRLIGRPGSGPEKEQRYVDTAEIMAAPSDFDSKLFDTRIAGTFFRDLLVMEGRIEFLDTLYLMREPDNKYDTHAILVTSDDGYVLGYVPKAVNTLPASLMDAGEKLYAVLICDSVDEQSPCISIMRSNLPVKNGKVITLPFGSRDSWMDSDF